MKIFIFLRNQQKIYTIGLSKIVFSTDFNLYYFKILGIQNMFILPKSIIS